MEVDRRTLIASALAIAPAFGSEALAAATAPSGSAADPLGTRADFPITRSGATFLNTAYSAPIPTPVIRAGIAALERKGVDPFSEPEVETARSAFAKLVNAATDEIAFLRSTGDAENVIARGLNLKRGDNVVITSLHYDNEYLFYRALERETGVEFRIAPHRDGAVGVPELAPYVDKQTRLVSIALVSHQNGFLHDLKSIADLAHAHGAYLYADAIQAIGTITVDVKAANVDFLCAGAYKWLLARTGIAPFYIRRELFDRLRLDRYGEGQIADRLPDRHYKIHADARRFEAARPAVGPAAELAAGLHYIDQIGIGRIEAHTVGLGRRLQEGLERQGRRLFTPFGNAAPIVAFYIDKPVPEVREIFAENRFVATARDGTVRVAPALFNSSDEIDRFLDLVRKKL